jgi:hypothetical protein
METSSVVLYLEDTPMDASALGTVESRHPLFRRQGISRGASDVMLMYLLNESNQLG